MGAMTISLTFTPCPPYCNSGHAVFKYCDQTLYESQMPYANAIALRGGLERLYQAAWAEGQEHLTRHIQTAVRAAQTQAARSETVTKAEKKHGA